MTILIIELVVELEHESESLGEVVGRAVMEAAQGHQYDKEGNWVGETRLCGVSHKRVEEDW